MMSSYSTSTMDVVTIDSDATELYSVHSSMLIDGEQPATSRAAAPRVSYVRTVHACNSSSVNALLVQIRQTLQFDEQKQSVVVNADPPAAGYYVKKLLGAGGFGRVFECVDSGSTGRRVAVKLIVDADATDASRRPSDLTLKSMQSESIGLGLVHPNVVRTIALGWVDPDDHGDESYAAARAATPNRVRLTGAVVLDLVDGRDLLSIIDDPREVLDYVRRLRFTSDIAAGLAYMHSRGVVHMDVKPGNVIVRGADDCCLLSDFGCAVRYASNARVCAPIGDGYLLPAAIMAPTTSGAQSSTTDVGGLGTIIYRAPELMTSAVRINTINLASLAKADVYALGVTMWQMVTRQRPYADYPRDALFNFVTAITEYGARPDGSLADGHRWSSTPAYKAPDADDLVFSMMWAMCWTAEPVNRPTAADMSTYMQSALAAATPRL